MREFITPATTFIVLAIVCLMACLVIVVSRREFSFDNLNHFLKEVPTWAVLFVLLILLLTGYYIRPDNVTEDAIKAIIGALLGALMPRPPMAAPPILPNPLNPQPPATTIPVIQPIPPVP